MSRYQGIKTVDGFFQGDYHLQVSSINVSNNATISGPLNVNIGSAADIGVTVKGSSTQTGNLQNWTDYNDNVLTVVRDNGEVFTSGGIHIARPLGAASLVINDGIDEQIEHDLTSNTANFDYTGGIRDNLMTDTAGVFQASDVGHWILVHGGTYDNASAEIKEYISATQVVLHTLGWTYDIVDFGYYIITRPQLVIGDGRMFMYNADINGHMDIQSADSWIGSSDITALKTVKLNSGVENRIASRIFTTANGYSTIGQYNYLNSGDIAPGKVSIANYSFIDVSGAVSADATTSIDCFVAGVANGTAATTKGFVALHGLETALQVYGDAAINPGYGYEVTSGVVVDRVNGGTDDTTAFLDTSVSNLSILDNDNDYILIGADAIFEVIDVNLTSISTHDCTLIFEYSAGAGVYTAIPTVLDRTIGMTQSGAFRFSAPVGWAKNSQAEAPADITDAYYVKITRTKNLVTTPPVEAYFKIRLTRDDGMRIRGDGSIEPVQAEDAIMANNSLYYSITQGKLCYKDLVGVVNDLYL